jgi:hypothetical protein
MSPRKVATIHYGVKRSGKGVVVLALRGHRRSLRDVARELEAMGYTNKRGAPYSVSMRQVDGRVALVIHSTRRWITDV